MPTPPAAVDNLSQIYPQDMGGNDDWGDCVVVACRTSFEVSWKTLTTEPMPVISAADCIAAYKAAGHYTSPPGDGLVTEQFLDWLLVHGLTGDPRTKPLAWGAVRDDWTSIEEVDAEFVGGIYGVVVHAAQEYPAKVWDGGSGQGQVEGGHEIGGGRYDPTYIYANTWAYQAMLTRSFVGNTNDFEEHHVIIWPHVWDSLTPERRTQIAADFQALTGKEFPTDPIVPTGFAVKRLGTATVTPGDKAIRLINLKTLGNVVPKLASYRALDGDVISLPVVNGGANQPCYIVAQDSAMYALLARNCTFAPDA
jgi:hypothetical protein